MNLPLQFGENPAFVRFMRQFVPRWPSISWQTLTRTVLNQGEEIKKHIHDEMIKVHAETDVAFTADMWSSKYGDRYLTTTLHWIDNQWQLRKHILGKVAFVIYFLIASFACCVMSCAAYAVCLSHTFFDVPSAGKVARVPAPNELGTCCTSTGRIGCPCLWCCCCPFGVLRAF